MDEKHIDRIVISGPLLELVRNNYVDDYDDFFQNIYGTEEFDETIRTILKWAYDYVEEHEIG